MPRSEEFSALVLVAALKGVLIFMRKLGIVAVNLAVPLFEYLDFRKSGRKRGIHGKVIARVGSSPVKIKGIVTEYVMSA